MLCSTRLILLWNSGVCFVPSLLIPFQDKVDVVKMTMQDNIQQMLLNEERLDRISENAENLNEQVRTIPAHTNIAGSPVAFDIEVMWGEIRFMP